MVGAKEGEKRESAPTPRRTVSLAALVARIRDENRHELIDFGPPVGREEW